jgi:hypothetical protein
MGSASKAAAPPLVASGGGSSTKPNVLVSAKILLGPLVLDSSSGGPGDNGDVFSSYARRCNDR